MVVDAGNEALPREGVAAGSSCVVLDATLLAASCPFLTFGDGAALDSKASAYHEYRSGIKRFC